jgi:TrmH family RNA methyltransferase
LETISIQKIKWIKSLHLKKNREKENLFLVEGEKIVTELLLNFPTKIKLIVCKSSFTEKSEELKTIRKESVFLANTEEMERMSTLTNASTVLAVVEKIQPKAIDTSKRLVLLDGIQDPGNLGTIIRTADWFGIDQILCSPTTVDLYNSKTLQATMGSFLRVSIHYLDLKIFIQENQETVYAALMEGVPYQQIPKEQVKMILLGNEGKGISEELLPLLKNPITIVGKGQAESLNVGVASGILLSYFCEVE